MVQLSLLYRIILVRGLLPIELGLLEALVEDQG
jgi:hypothetical protein